MTRRDRLIRIVEWFDERRRRWEFEGLIARHGLSVLTDEAMEEYARACIASYKFSQKLNRENRARLAMEGGG